MLLKVTQLLVTWLGRYTCKFCLSWLDLSFINWVALLGYMWCVACWVTNHYRYCLNCNLFFRILCKLQYFFLFPWAGSVILAMMGVDQPNLWDQNSMPLLTMWQLTLASNCHQSMYVLFSIQCPKTTTRSFSEFSWFVQYAFGLQMKLLVAAAIALKGVGGLLFVFGSSLGAYLLVRNNCSLRIYHLIWLNDKRKPFKLYEILFQLLHQAVATPILYDFYNYDVDKKEFSLLFSKFTQVSKSHIGFSFVGYHCLAILKIWVPYSVLIQTWDLLLCVFDSSELGTPWGTSLLHWNEELEETQ